MRNPKKLTNREIKARRTDTDWRQIVALLGLILIISFVVYLPVFQNGLLAWDDEGYIKNNPLVYSFNLKEIFSKYAMGNWHPFTILILAVEYHLFGLNATGYHTINLLLHLLNIVLVFYTVYLLSNKSGVALVASFLFGIHPMHVESVAWVSELKDLLYTFFFLASYIFYLRYISESRKKLYFIALALFLASLLSKAMAASLPVVFLLTDYFMGRKIDKKAMVEKIPFFMLSVIFGVVAIFAQKSSGSTYLATVYSFPERIVFAAYGYITYLVKLIFPLNLSAFYPYPVVKGGGVPSLFYLYLLFLILLAVYIYYTHRFTRKIIFGMGFFTITILLVLQLLPVGKAIMADRYSYIPSIGIFYLAGEGFMYLLNKQFKWPAIALICVAGILFSIQTFARGSVWKDDMTLWNYVISKEQNAAEAYYNRGVIYMKQKKNGEALKDFNRVIELEPRFANSYNGRGVIYTSEKRGNEAVSEFNRAIELNPGYAEAYYNRGVLYLNNRNVNEAIRDFTKAIELNPAYPEAFNNRGTALLNSRKIDEAIRDFSRAIELRPVYAEAYNNRGSVFINARRINEALKDLNQAIELSPGYAEAYYNRGILYSNERKNEEAIKDFNRAIELKPDYAIAYNNRGIVFVNMKRNDEAIKDFARAIELKPDYADALNNRGYLYMTGKRYEEAFNDFNRAIELNPNYIGAYNNMGDLLYELKRFDGAAAAFTKVIELKADYGQAYYKRGISAYNSGNKALACADLRKAVELGFKAAEEALARICN